MKLSELVGLYVELRDKKTQLKGEFDAKVATIDAKLDKIEGALLKTFDSAGMNSFSSDNGTAYSSTRTSASVADKDIFMSHVKATGEWHLLETRVSKLAVEQVKAETGMVPPGVNWSETRVVNVRRSA